MAENIQTIMIARDNLIKKENELYIAAAENINMRLQELVQDDNFGSILVRNTGKDLAGELIRRYLDFGDYYITVDQVYERFVNFSYDNELDPLASNEAMKKTIYNFNDAETAESIQNINERSKMAQEYLCEENRKKDKLDKTMKKKYRDKKINHRNNTLTDELTGEQYKVVEDKTKTQGENKSVERENSQCENESSNNLHADHVQSRAAAMYNSRYIVSEEAKQELKKFINSDDNMELMHASANTSKGDVRICEVDGKRMPMNAKEMKSRQDKGEKIVDVTYNATPEEMTEAVVALWEKDTKTGNKIATLRKHGYLDKDGKVKPAVKKRLLRKFERSQNKESTIILKNASYKNITKDAIGETKNSLGKILAGQIIYYFVPPIIFETKALVKRDDLTLDKFFGEFKKAGSRIIKYVSSKLKKILQNLMDNAFSKFLKTFFDIIIEMLKATIKRLMEIVKDVVMSLINCGKVLLDKEASSSQKADSITKILATTVTTVVIQLIFEYLGKQFTLPGFLVDPLQIIVTVLATNIIMLVLQKLDLFDVKYGLLVSNIEKIFDEETKIYLNNS